MAPAFFTTLAMGEEEVCFNDSFDLADLPECEQEEAKALGGKLSCQDDDQWKAFVDAQFAEYFDNVDDMFKEACSVDVMRGVWIKKKYTASLKAFLSHKMKLELLEINVTSC